MRDLERTVSQLQESLREGSALMTEKDAKIETQAKREKELIACVHRYVRTTSKRALFTA